MNMSTLWHDMKPSAATAIPDDRQSERVTRYAWKALAGSAIGYAMDGFDLLILGFMLLWAGTVMGMFVNGMVGGYGTLMSGAYPTAARATAQNVLWNLGRAVRRIWPDRRGGARDDVFVPGGHCAAREHLPAGHTGDAFPDSGAQGW
jgi:hypothetical protein